jgi:MFS family permease
LEQQEGVFHRYLCFVSLSGHRDGSMVLIHPCSFGGLLYGYQQGVLGEVFVMTAFGRDFPGLASNAGKKGWLTSILQLGGWIGSLSSGVFAEVFSRKHTMFGGALGVVLGSFLSAGAQSPSYLFAGRFFTGLGVGTLSAIG